jgi:mono/diheme cytochrome c family protein
MKSITMIKSMTTSNSLLAGTGAAAFALVAVLGTLGARPAQATAQFAKETGKSCGACHTAAAGGGPLTPFGEKFHANGDKLP